MTKKNVVAGIVLPIIAGLFLILSAISTWAFEEKSLTAQEQLEKAKQESELFNLGIPSTQRDDSLPGLKISDPDAKTPIGVDNIVCWGECMNAVGSEYVWKCGYMKRVGTKYFIDNFECGRERYCYDDRSCPKKNSKLRNTAPKGLGDYKQ